MQYESLLTNRAAFRKHYHGRRAMSLVEVLVVATLVSILFTVIVTLAVHLRQWDRQVRGHSLHTNQLANLAETVRADVRRATSVSQPDKNTVAIVGADNRDIRYEIQPGGCRRVAKAPDDKSPRIETFAIGPADSWKLETAAPGRRPAYSITLERSETDKATSHTAPFFVYAALGSETP
jgi:type II secretory pathway pseudopilin PulG